MISLLQTLLLSIIAIVTILTTGGQQQSSNLKYSAFCQENRAYNSRNFPVDAPELHLPWIWEAIYDPVTNVVDLTTMSRGPCAFNKTVWRQLLNRFPEYSDRLGHGLDSNILVPLPNYASDDQEMFLYHSTVTCEYFQGANFHPVHSTTSHKIRGKRPFVYLGTLQIRCPAPPNGSSGSWDSLRIRLHSRREEFKSKVFSEVTGTVPVCRLPNYSMDNKKYNLSICSATSRSDRLYLVEWIEYHRLLGVQHIFLYDTSTDRTGDVETVLRDYIDEGIITVVPWNFKNCVRNMANGRWTLWFENNIKYHFKSPRAISQSAALASCYSRFRHTSKYITHIDDDEFIAFDRHKVESILESKDEINSLVDFIDAVFQKNHRATTIKLNPVTYYPCAILPEGLNYEPSNSLISSFVSFSQGSPRLGNWRLSEPSEEYESKLIMRTDAVGMFFVHFVSLIDHGPWFKDSQKSVVEYPIKVSAVLHYKHPGSLPPYNILEEMLPITNYSFPGLCQSSYQLGYLFQNFHANVSENQLSKLQKQYKIRINL